MKVQHNVMQDKISGREKELENNNANEEGMKTAGNQAKNNQRVCDLFKLPVAMQDAALWVILMTYTRSYYYYCSNNFYIQCRVFVIVSTTLAAGNS